jgi:hypothetical protein
MYIRTPSKLQASGHVSRASTPAEGGRICGKAHRQVDTAQLGAIGCSLPIYSNIEMHLQIDDAEHEDLRPCIGFILRQIRGLGAAT